MARVRRRGPFRSASPSHDAGLGSRVVLLTSRFRFVDRTTWYGRARLYGDRIELSHWTLLGPKRVAVPLHQVLDFAYHPADETGNVRLELESVGSVSLLLGDAHRWRAFFEEWLRYAVLPSAKLIGSDADPSASLAG